MKRMMSVMLAAVLALSLAACGKTDNGGSADQSIDLKEFYNTLYQGDDAPAMEELPEELQAVLLARLGDERAADILEAMDPDDAADLLAELSNVDRNRLLELMEQAETMSDLLEIESRLTEVRGELERYASQLKVLDNQIDYATVNLSLSEVTEYTPVVEKSRLEKIRDGFVSSVKGVGNLILDFISFVLMNIPYILLFGLILWGLLALVKRHRRKHPKKPKAEPKKED